MPLEVVSKEFRPLPVFYYRNQKDWNFWFDDEYSLKLSICLNLEVNETSKDVLQRHYQIFQTKRGIKILEDTDEIFVSRNRYNSLMISTCLEAFFKKRISLDISFARKNFLYILRSTTMVKDTPWVSFGFKHQTDETVLRLQLLLLQ